MALLLFPSLASLADIDHEPVEVDEIILMVSSTSLSCSSLDELEASLSCVKTPAAELPEPAAIALIISTTLKIDTIYLWCYGNKIVIYNGTT